MVILCMKKMCFLFCSNGLNCKIFILFYIVGMILIKCGVVFYVSVGFVLLDVLLVVSLFVVGMLGFLFFYY